MGCGFSRLGGTAGLYFTDFTPYFTYFTPLSGFQLPCSLRTTTICPT